MSSIRRNGAFLQLVAARRSELPGAIKHQVWGRPGELLHLDARKLGRILKVGHRITGNARDTVDGAGWEYVRVAIG